MLVRKISLENVRSFLDRQEMTFDGSISIIVGPNGGGKTNLLDTIVTMLRRYLIAAPYIQEVRHGDGETYLQATQNDLLNNLAFDKHSSALGLPQVVEITVEVSHTDIASMSRIKEDAEEVERAQKWKFHSSPWIVTQSWEVEAISSGDQFTYTWSNGSLVQPAAKPDRDFLQYLQIFELDNSMRSEAKMERLQLPMIYLPVSRTSAAFQSSVALSGFNDREQKRQFDSTTSRSGGSNIVQLAIGRLGRRYRRLELDDNTAVRTAFYDDSQLASLTKSLSELGYTWALETVNSDTNEYDVILTKQGTRFASGAASSGERELLTYLFAIYALNVRDAVIVVDEPELHLHPRWQKTLLGLFERMSRETGNQFVLATHSPTFISPSSIQYVSRVYSEEQKSKISRLDPSNLPNSKHLFNIVNSQNNERLFFCDHVVLVEGISDRMFFEKLLERFGTSSRRDVIEIISVGGKGLFDSYSKLLQACSVPYSIIADLDYVDQVGSAEIKRLFRRNDSKIKTGVIDNIGSLDGQSLVARIDEAMASNDWSDATALWEYIKSKRVSLRPSLTEAEQSELAACLDSLRSRGIYILSRGTLENYLPQGYRGKDVEKLIALLQDEDFWSKLPCPERDEVEDISRKIFSNELLENESSGDIEMNELTVHQESSAVGPPTSLP